MAPWRATVWARCSAGARRHAPPQHDAVRAAAGAGFVMRERASIIARI
jgi:hypothetical protein